MLIQGRTGEGRGWLFSMLVTGVIVAVLSIGMPVSADPSGTQKTSAEEESIQKAYQEELEKAKKDFVQALRKAKHEHNDAVKSAKEKLAAAKGSASEVGDDVKKAYHDTVKEAGDKLREARRTAKIEWIKAKDAAKKKFKNVSKPAAW